MVVQIELMMIISMDKTPTTLFEVIVFYVLNMRCRDVCPGIFDLCANEDRLKSEDPLHRIFSQPNLLVV